MDDTQSCHYLIKRANDGDSFHVSVNGKEYIFRLYFVDTPEVDTEFPQRVKEQARYFGITPEQATPGWRNGQGLYQGTAESSLCRPNL